jgi:hypothetical protein
MKNCRNITLAPPHHICQADELTNGDYHLTDEFCLYPSVKADLFSPIWVNSPAWARTSSLERLHHHMRLRCTTIGTTPLDK